MANINFLLTVSRHYFVTCKLRLKVYLPHSVSSSRSTWKITTLSFQPCSIFAYLVNVCKFFIPQARNFFVSGMFGLVHSWLVVASVKARVALYLPLFFGVFVRPGLGAVFIDSGVQIVLSFRLMMIVLLSPFVIASPQTSFEMNAWQTNPKGRLQGGYLR